MRCFNGCFHDTQNPTMAGAEYQKIIDAWFIYQMIFVSFGNIFVSEVFEDYFISFYKKYGNSVGKTFLGCSYHSYGTNESTYYYFILCIYFIYKIRYIIYTYIHIICMITYIHTYIYISNQTVFFSFPVS